MSEMTCNQFVRAMADAGFSFTYRATDGDKVFTGKVGNIFEEEIKNTPSIEQSRRAIKQLFKGQTT